ncbi:hypothetical protein BC351_00460 [Paenibacillus ferrarius]|uniref:Uncharacterized protein n=1 Tax=Paenibacillus ferrarius TaxID=1469647 RepID=A0A1V4HSJ0_9BACL|nr:hypothetical protein [Paenibacillus ferrarius]OPH61748.1 hypothetical protein BC351_00460 [Paenibacillus ferrarius]
MELLLDIVEYKSKPSKEEVRKINYRILNHPNKVTVQQLANEILKGKTFIPALINKKVNGKLRRSINCWSSQEVICLDFDDGMTIENALIEFKDNAAFIYKTFNHTDKHHKFRVVFILDRVITNYNDFSNIMNELLSRYPMADRSCSDGSRMFYGGTEIMPINYNNRLEVSNYVDKDKNNYNGDNVSTLVLDLKHFTPYMDTLSPLDVNKPVKSSNLTYIRRMDLDSLHSVLNPNELRVHTHEEVYDYVKKQNLSDFLGVTSGGYFSCIFHNDVTPSANIFQNSDTGHYMYKCFSTDCTFKFGTIMKCVERLLKCDKVSALRFLRKVYKVNYHETDWQKEQKEIIEENMRYVRSDDFKHEYPVQYKLMKPYLENLHTFLSLAKDNLPPEQYKEDQKLPLFYTTMKQFANLCSQKDPRRLVDRIGLFAFMCYLYKLKEDEVPKHLLKKAKFELVKNKKRDVMNMHSFFMIESFSEEVMTRAEGYAQSFYDNHLTMSAWGWELLYRTFGEEEANRVYPQLKKKKITELSHNSAYEIDKAIRDFIAQRGWATEREVLDYVELEVKVDTYKNRQMKRMIGELLEKYGLKRKKLNNKLKEALSIPDLLNEDGNMCYPVIIYK